MKTHVTPDTTVPVSPVSLLLLSTSIIDSLSCRFRGRLVIYEPHEARNPRHAEFLVSPLQTQLGYLFTGK